MVWNQEHAKLQASDAPQQVHDRKQVEKVTAEEISRRTARKIGDVRLQGVAMHIAENPLNVSNQKAWVPCSLRLNGIVIPSSGIKFNSFISILMDLQ